VANRQELFELLDAAFLPERARDIAANLTRYYRSPGSSGYLAATDSVAQALEEAKLDELEIKDYPVDGWEPLEGHLTIKAPEEIHLVDYESAPSSAVWWSDPTDPDGERLEVIDVGTGESPEDFDRKDIKGKAVFVHGTSRRPGWWEAAKNALEYGARGIITDYQLYQTAGLRTPELVPDATQLLRLPYQGEKIWAFSISHNASKKLTKLLQEGEEVIVKALVQAKSFSGVVRNVLGTIRGTDEPDMNVLFCAHTSGIKPGGNCAEGPGMVAELARALKDLIDRGIVERPRRSIKFLICCEGAGTNNYLAENPDELQNIITTMTYCSTGHKQEKTASALLMYRSPDSVPSYINDYLAELIETSRKDADWIGKEGGKELPLVTFTDHYYTPWSDNTRFAADGLPAPLFMSWPDRYFHSQFLTEDVIDPAALRRAALVSGVAGLELASAQAAQAMDIAKLVASRSVMRITRAANNYRFASKEDHGRAARHLKYIADRDMAGMKTVMKLVPGTDRAQVEDVLEKLEARIRGVVTEESADFIPVERELPAFASLVPVKKSDGRIGRWAGLTYQDLLEIGEDLNQVDPMAGWRSLRVVSDETWNFVNGERSVAEIADAVGFEFGLKIEPAPIYRILQGLESEGHLEFK